MIEVDEHHTFGSSKLIPIFRAVQKLNHEPIQLDMSVFLLALHRGKVNSANDSEIHAMFYLELASRTFMSRR